MLAERARRNLQGEKKKKRTRPKGFSSESSRKRALVATGEDLALISLLSINASLRGVQPQFTKTTPEVLVGTPDLAIGDLA